MMIENKIVDEQRLLFYKSGWKEKKIVLCQGCFDLIHRGHIYQLEQAKLLGDILVVALNSDKSVREQKGITRPIIQDRDRAYVLSAISSVDFVTIFDQKTAVTLIQNLTPDIYVDDSKRSHLSDEAKAVLEYGGQLATVNYLTGYSTSEIINRIIKTNQ